jgi:hypothetical protein
MSVQGVDRNVAFIHHTNPEEAPKIYKGADSTGHSVGTGSVDEETTSFTNMKEAKMVTSLATYLVKQGYWANRLAIVTPYRGQKNVIRKELAHHFRVELTETLFEEFLAEREERHIYTKPTKKDIEDEVQRLTTIEVSRRVHVATIDDFQGQERDVVLISTVRNNTSNSLGFLKIRNRVNVLLSRAKHGMYIFGNQNLLKKCRTDGASTMWKDVMHLLARHGCVGTSLQLCCPHSRVKTHLCTAGSFQECPPCGVCNLTVSELPCGHTCPLPCHFVDYTQWNVRLEPLKARLEGVKCVEKGGVVNLPCGHQREVTCHEKHHPHERLWKMCLEEVTYKMKCGHTRTMACGDLRFERGGQQDKEWCEKHGECSKLQEEADARKNQGAYCQTAKTSDPARESAHLMGLSESDLVMTA